MKVVHIEWLDSQTEDGWTAKDDVTSALELTHTVGFLVHENDLCLVVAHSMDAQTDSFNGLITIPRQAIERQRTLCRVAP